MVPNPNLQHKMRQVMYQLMRQYGAPIEIYQPTSVDTDYFTGSKTASKSKIDVRFAAVLPAESVRKFFQGISYIAESRVFVSQGAGWDQDARGFIIDAIDTPGYTPEVEHWIVYDGKKYEISDIKEMEYQTGWLLVGKRVRGSDPERIINVNIVDTILPDDEAEAS